MELATVVHPVLVYVPASPFNQSNNPFTDFGMLKEIFRACVLLLSSPSFAVKVTVRTASVGVEAVFK